MRGSPYAVVFGGVEATGIAPTMLQQFRAQVASASGVSAAGRCATTAIALAFKVDPAIELFRRLLVAFARWSCDALLEVSRLRVAWRKAFEVMIGPHGPNFAKVTGPMGAVIASVASVGWCPFSLEAWPSPDGVRWAVGPSSVSKVAKAILSDVQVILWRLAARHHLGQGLELSPPADVSFRWARQLASGASSIELGALECIMSGGLWLPHRVNSIRDWVPDVCPRCSQPFCDELHLCLGVSAAGFGA